MNHLFKRIIAFLLSITIVFVSVLIYSTNSYALPKRLHDGTWIDVPISEYGQEISYFIQYAVNQMGAFYSGDFEGWLKNNKTFSDLYDDNGRLAQNVSVDQETGTVTITADLVALIKQALIEYANETNGFKTEKTYPVNAIPASIFQNKTAYESFKSFCASHAFTVANPQGSYMYLGDATPYIKEGGGFVNESGGNIVVYNSYWIRQSIPMNYYQFLSDESGNPYVKVTENWGIQVYISHYIANKNDFAQFRQTPYLVTKDGGRIRVFNSASAFMNYDAGQRKVYFGSGFYDYDPSDITATWDEINDRIGRMDDILQDILDEITNTPNISEEDLEKLIDKLLDKIGEIGGELGDKTDETNNILSGIASSLSGYYSEVLAALDEILEAIKALVWIEADNKLDDDKSDLFDLLDKIWKDPENGSQEAADALTASFSDIVRGLTKKFPFSIPWDIYNLFRVFSGAPAPDEASFRPMTLGVEPFTVDNEDLEQDIHDAPYFKLPLRLDSYGIYEEVVIDLSDFKSVSTLSRALLSVLFAVFLIKFTILLIDLFKGGAGD